MIHQIFFDYFGLERENVWIIEVDDHPNPVHVRGTESFKPRKVLDDPTSCGVNKRLVDTKDVAISMNHNYGSVKSQSLRL